MGGAVFVRLAAHIFNGWKLCICMQREENSRKQGPSWDGAEAKTGLLKKF